MRSLDEIKSILLENGRDPDIVAWVCFRFHPNSPTQKQVSLGKDEYATEQTGVSADMYDSNVQDVAAEFFILLADMKWELYLSTEVSMAEMLRELRSPLANLEDDKKVKALEIRGKYPDYIRKLIETQNDLWQEITGGDDEATRIMRRIAANRRTLGAEAMAKPI